MSEDVEYIIDTKKSPHSRGNRLLEAAERKAVDFDFVASLKKDEEPYVRSSVARALSNFKRRDTLGHLLELMCDPEMHVRGDAVLAAGELGDSRATFAMINFFRHVQYELQKRVFIALKVLGDPRALCFLDDFVKRENDVGDLARDAYSACANNENFSYEFAGRNEAWEYAKQTEGRIFVSTDNILDGYSGIVGRIDKPQTYVVDMQGRLWIGGENLHEHVDVARGERVLSAGEIIFKKSGNIWKVGYANNRSNGYYPAENSFVHVSQALSNAGIKEDRREFSEIFPRDGFCSDDFLTFQRFYKEASLEYL